MRVGQEPDRAEDDGERRDAKRLWLDDEHTQMLKKTVIGAMRQDMANLVSAGAMSTDPLVSGIANRMLAGQDFVRQLGGEAPWVE